MYFLNPSNFIWEKKYNLNFVLGSTEMKVQYTAHIPTKQQLSNKDE